MVAPIRRLALVTWLLFIGLALGLGYWQIVRAPDLVRRGDNPRLVLAEKAIVRGTIFDRRGTPLALTRLEGDRLIRDYPEPLAEPLVGHYSLQHGAAWAEAAFDARLRGVEGKSEIQLWWDRLLHKPQVGQAVTLTLDMGWQRAAYAALGTHTGVALVADVPTGQIRACASRPSFDPNSLDANWERLRADSSAPLLNRAAQGYYQPGSLFQTVVLEEALRAGHVALTGTVTAPEASVIIRGTTLGCAFPLSQASEATWADVYAAGCPAPFARLAEQISLSALEAGIRRWQLDMPVDIGLPGEEAAGRPAPLAGSDRRELVLGQGPLTLTPLHVLRMALTLANDGRSVPSPLAVASASQPDPSHILRAEDAAALRSAWRRECGLSGLAGLAASGPRYLAWYMGVSPPETPRYAVVILVEDAVQVAVAQAIACQVAGGGAVRGAK